MSVTAATSRDISDLAQVNIAPEKPVYASSQFGNYAPKAANDVNFNTIPSISPLCFQSDPTDMSPYWLIDLGKTTEIAAVRITNRGDCCGRF